MQPFDSLVPAELLQLSGGVYYSGADAFTGTSPLYLLGLNPGGDPAALRHHTVEQHLRATASAPANHSAYRDESWENGRPAGTWGMQPRVLHLLDRLGLDPGEVPASNLVFARSTREATMQAGRMDAYADLCWPFHAAVIETLQVRVVVCFGGTVGRQVRTRLGAQIEVGRFKETNNRGWTSYVHEAPSGVRVVTVSHPSIADWSNPATDVSDLVAFALSGDEEHVGHVGDDVARESVGITMSTIEGMNPTARRRGHTPLTRHEALHFSKAWTAEDRAKVARTLDSLGVVEVTLAPAGQEFAAWDANGEKVLSGMGGTLWLGMTEVADGVVRQTAAGEAYQVVLLSNATGSARGESRPADVWPETCPKCFVKHGANDDCW